MSLDTLPPHPTPSRKLTICMSRDMGVSETRWMGLNYTSDSASNHPSTEMPLTFFLGPVLLHPVRNLPQAVKKEVSFLQTDDLREEGEAGMGASGSRNSMFWLGGQELPGVDQQGARLQGSIALHPNS